MSPGHRNQNLKETEFILGDSMMKKLNGFLLTRKLSHTQPFSSAKVRCMHDHVKPTVRHINPDHIILYYGANHLSSDRTASQIARSIIQVAFSLKSQDNKISIFLIVPRNENLNNKGNEVNSRLIHMCSK